MFNLLVKSSAWANGRDTMSAGRTFEYTDDAIVDRFKPAGQLDFAALVALPTLFVQETWMEGDQLARVGSIIQARVRANDIALQYTYDLGIPPIPNKILKDIAAELEINNAQLSRTHWSVKDVDLYKTPVLGSSLHK